MEFKEGKKVRVVRESRKYDFSIPFITTMDKVGSVYPDVCFVDEDNYIINFSDCEEIETKPTLEEVKEYFKDAKEVNSSVVFGWNYIQLNKINVIEYGVYYDGDVIRQGEDKEGCCIALWHDGNFAEIVSYKDDKPQRYTTRAVNGLDVIDLVKHWNLNFNEGNILKYLLRDKGQDIQDLEKIIDYAQRELKHLKE